MNTVGILKPQHVPWKKLLYLKQPYPDNYIDESFLNQLKRNETVSQVPYFKLVQDFSLIVFHVNNLVFVILLFAGIYHHHWDPFYATAVSTGVSLLGYVSWRLYLNSGKKTSSSIKSFVLIIFVLSILSPVLKSLTRSTASDSIWFLSFLLTFANLIFHDYAINASGRPYKPIISTNMALSNALVLASRFSSAYQQDIAIWLIPC
ncbi:glycosylphosphatidylinositol anchor biosynthesis [Yamadazyma tenuis]|uniref:glycosylphosphatidylinositol anchor biosynthesis n=1 Tax=Candida tenuis TaxID=2315449 RepID=UPI0027A1493C|nr:glycosylphosphatidylinositol anchor biosynthesis [Yamadazyma tenuis]